MAARSSLCPRATESFLGALLDFLGMSVRFPPEHRLTPHVDTTFESPRVLGVCAGIGGLEQGIKRVFPRSRLVGICERDSYAAAVLLARMEEQAMDPAPIFAGDLNDFPASEFSGYVDIICGGIPCQPYSSAGKQLRGSDSRDLVDTFVSIVGEVGPSLVFVENVAAFVRGGLGRLLGGLTALGYNAEWTTLRASDVGAPHKRDRCFTLGYTKCKFTERRGKYGNLEVAPENIKSRSTSGYHGERVLGADGSWPLPWPPGPARRAAWSGVLEHSPELSPAIRDVRGMADGVPEGLVYRTDRLRCLGNAVVPAQAAEALRTLLSRIDRSVPE